MAKQTPGASKPDPKTGNKVEPTKRKPFPLQKKPHEGHGHKGKPQHG